MSARRTVFLTGATGFIGSRVASLLLERGDAVRCLVRSSSRATALSSRGAVLLEGDITDVAVLQRGMEGADAAIHLAAVYDVGVVDKSAMWVANVNGTAAFIAAVSASGLQRAVYISTTVALGPVPLSPGSGSGSGSGDEHSRNHGPFGSVYEETKVRAHSAALEAQSGGVPLMIACPAYVYGPGDTGPGARFLTDLLKRRVPGLLSNPSWFSFVHVDDVATGIIAVLDRGEPGDTYVLSGEDATINDFARRAASLGGVSAPFLRFPAPLARMTGVMLDGVTRLTGFRFPITRENVNTAAGKRWLHSHRKATEELGWEPRSLDEGLRSTVEWIRSG